MCLAVPGRVVEIKCQNDNTLVGLVDYGTVKKQVNLSFVPECQVDNYVLVHAGFAISVLDEAEANASLDTFKALGIL